MRSRLRAHLPLLAGHVADVLLLVVDHGHLHTGLEVFLRKTVVEGFFEAGLIEVVELVRDVGVLVGEGASVLDAVDTAW